MNVENSDEFELSSHLPDPNRRCSVEEMFDALGDDQPANQRSHQNAFERPAEVISSAAERSNEVIAINVTSSSNKVIRRRRRSDAKDRQIIDGIRNSVMERDEDGGLALVGDFYTSILTTSWEHTGDRMKLAFANEALELQEDVDKEKSGARPVSWSLNLGPDRLAGALDHSKGFVGCLAGLINRALASRLGYVPFYWFMVDIEKDRLHLHGGILASPDQLPVIEEAVRHAGGKWSASSLSGEKHQFHFNSVRCDYGWITYAMKRKAQVKRIIGPHSFFIGKSLRKKAGWLYGRYRQILRGEANDA